MHIVVNGIVENYMELKQELLAEGAEFTSETDVEVMAHLIARELDETGDLTEAVRRAYNRLRGHYALRGRRRRRAGRDRRRPQGVPADRRPR